MSDAITIAGIDPSLTNTALITGTSPDDFSVTMHKSASVGMKPSPSKRIPRYERVVESIMSVLDDEAPDVVVIEGYSFHSGAPKKRGQPQKSNPYVQMMLYGMGEVLRWHLLEFTKVIVEVAPGTLKKFVFEKGNASKELMVKEVYRRWGFDTTSNDQADAYGLFRLGLVMAEVCEPENQAQREAVKTVMDGHDLTNDLIQAQAGEAPF